MPECFQENGSYLHGSELRVSADQEHLHSAILFHGQGQREVAEGVKGNGNFGAFWADQRRFEQAVEDVHDNGIIPQPVICPCFLSYNLQINEIPTSQATFFSLRDKFFSCQSLHPVFTASNKTKLNGTMNT